MEKEKGKSSSGSLAAQCLALGHQFLDFIENHKTLRVWGLAGAVV